MIEEIYDSCGDLYPDLRNYNSPEKILQQRLRVKERFRKLSPLCRLRKTRNYKRLQREEKFLLYKYWLYTNSLRLPQNLETTRFLVKMTDRMGRENKRQSKAFRKIQTQILIHLSHLKLSDTEFTAFYEKMIQ